MNINKDRYPKFNKSLEDYRKLSYHSEKHYDYKSKWREPKRNTPIQKQEKKKKESSMLKDGWQHQLESFTEEDWKQVGVTKETLVQILEFLSKK